jgi:hypothetical protein
MERIDPLEPMERIECSEAKDQRDDGVFIELTLTVESRPVLGRFGRQTVSRCHP